MRTPPRHLALAAAAFALIGAGAVAWGAARGAPRVPAQPQMLVLIDEAARAELGPLLDQYRRDAQRSLSPTYGTALRVEVQELDLVSYFPAGTIDEAGQNRLTVDVARDLRMRYEDDGLVGFVVVGAIPLPRAYDGAAPRLTLYPWMDFERPAFVEDPAHGRFVRSGEEDPRPEIWSGVIRAPGNPSSGTTIVGASAALPVPSLRSFFERNHRVHTGELRAPRRFFYVDLDTGEALRDVRLPGGRIPTKEELPGGNELALRGTTERFAARLVSAGRYNGVNFADDHLPKPKAEDRTKTVQELLDKARKDGDFNAVERWKNGSGPLKQADVASQVLIYLDRWSEIEEGRLNAAREAARLVVTRPGFDLFARGGYEFCADRAPAAGNGYFSLAEAQQADIARRSGIASRAEFEFLLRWTKVYTDGEKRLALVRDGIPPVGRYRGLDPASEVRFTVAPGTGAYEVRGARLDGACLQAGPAGWTGGLVEVLLGAATARETSAERPAGLALWSTARGLTQAAYGTMLGPPAPLTLPPDLAALDQAQIAALAARAESPGFGRSASVRSTAEGAGFEADPFLLAIISGLPIGEAVRPTFDEPSVLYGDPTVRLP